MEQIEYNETSDLALYEFYQMDDETLDINTDFDIEELNTEILDDEVIPTKTKRKRVVKNYINNSDFCDALRKYKEESEVAKENGLKKPRIPNYIGECFMKIADGLARKPNFFGYSFKDEMKADAIENCLLYFENFDPDRKNPFAYFTQIQFYCFLRRIHKEKRQQYVKYKSTEMFGILDESELMELGGGQVKQIEIYDNLYEFIKKFEETEFKKPIKPVVKKKPMGIETFLE